MQEKYLPLGTVVMLKGGTKRLMVTGFCAVTPNREGMFDYIGCLYPEGVLTSNQTALFNHDQIEKIYAVGFSDEEEINFKNELKETLKNKLKESIEEIK